ncbi:MAG: ATP-binding protein [Verrucomicrobiota bacterium]
MELDELEKIIAAGESQTVEFKKSTGLLTRAGETLCAFLNTRGGRVFFGITPEGQIVGQHISDNTQRDVAAMLSRFEPAATVETERIRLSNGHEVLILEARPAPQLAPFIFEGKPYQRIGSTTSVMPQSRYHALLLERSHANSRWETTPAIDYEVKDLDREAILSTVRLGVEAGRLPESTGRNVGSILDRLHLRNDGQILNGAVVLFAKDPLPHYPQCHLRLARFKGTTKDEFLDNRQLHGHAFYLLDEAMAFLHRHLPISGRFEPGKLERIDELLFPPTALREALVNGFCHRDYSIYGGAINVAIFDDRVEIWSDGKLPFGIRPGDLKRKHASKPRNLFITDVFFRRGLIEQWGRGTQKIVELCKKAGHPEPSFEEIAGSVVVTFRPASGSITPQVTTEVTTQVTTEVARLLPLCFKPRSKKVLRDDLGLRNDSHFRKAYLAPALAAGLLEMTIPDKPNSRLQEYRLTAKGRAWLAGQQNIK